MLVFDQIRTFLGRCWQWTTDLSFFYQQSTDPYEIESGRIATRMYIVLLISFLGTFNVYYSVTDVSQTISIKTPSIDTYQSLVQRFPNLACPCQNIGLLYRQFMELTPVYHQVEF